MVRTIWLLAAFVWVSSCGTSPGPQQEVAAPSEKVAFDDIARLYLEDVYVRNPTWSTYLGIHKYNERLEDYSRKAVDDAVAAARQFRERVAGIKADVVDSRAATGSRTAPARHRLAAPDSRSAAAVGRRARQLQQRAHPHRLHHDQARVRASGGAPASTDRAAESDAGGAGGGEEESRQPAANLDGNRHRADGRQSRVFRDRRRYGVPDCHRQGPAGRVQTGK